MIHPADFGAPERFARFRKQQGIAFGKLANSSSRIDVAALPVGVGKSLIAWTYARLMGARAVILTSTKGLQDQYVKDLGAVGLLDVRGMSNYPCKLLDIGTGYTPGCDQGPCLDGEACAFKEVGCGYYDAWRSGKDADIVVANYDAWFSHDPKQRQFSLGERDLVIADEAHELAQVITQAVGVSFNQKDIERKRGMETWSIDEWRVWAGERAHEAQGLLESEALSRGEKRKVRQLLEKFSRLAGSGSDWAHTWSSYGIKWSVELEPISPAPYVEAWLWRGAQKVVLLSATIRPWHMAELGYQPSDYHFIETPSPFRVENRPIYRVALGFRLNWKTSDTNLEFWVSKMDQIIRSRLDRKGIIHATSYDRADFIKRNSRHAAHMMTHRTHDARAVIERFKTAPPGTILVSPSVHTGWDFPGDQAEYQIIGKVPFPNTSTGLAKARKEADSEWDTRHAIATLVQSTGRPVRTETDFAETFIVDDTMNYLWGRFRSHFPLWFQDAYKQVESVPSAPTRKTS